MAQGAQYSVLRTCQVRAGFELSSERRGVLQAGQQVEGLEQRENEKGVVRVRIDRGWVSVKTKAGVAVLELVEAPSGSRRAEAGVRSASTGHCRCV